MKRAWTAHPCRDLDVIDANAPRFNQAVVGSLALVSFLTGWGWLLAVLAAQLAVTLLLGRRFCLPCLAYFELVQPWLGEGPIEDSRPPRFANLIGVAVLGGASLAHALGLTTLGWTLGLLVAALALIAAVTGLCVGCELYRLGARLRGVRSRALAQVDLDELGVPAATGSLFVQFTHPLCSACRTLEQRLRTEGRTVVTVDISERPELARKYGVAVVPTAVSVATGGEVTARLAG